MFDLNYQAQAHQAVCQERLQRALKRAEREQHTWSKTSRLTLSHRMLSQVGAALIAIGMWLQHNTSAKPAAQPKKA